MEAGASRNTGLPGVGGGQGLPVGRAEAGLRRIGGNPEQRTRLFQPFQSFFDGGTGLGMAIVYRLVQEHDGRVSVESKEGVGTTITVELPLRPAAAESERGTA